MVKITFPVPLKSVPLKFFAKKVILDDNIFVFFGTYI